MKPPPTTRGECAGLARPCARSCRYVLSTGACALDVADAGASTLEEVAAHFGVTRERIRQIEKIAVGKLRLRLATVALAGSRARLKFPSSEDRASALPSRWAPRIRNENPKKVDPVRQGVSANESSLTVPRTSKLFNDTALNCLAGVVNIGPMKRITTTKTKTDQFVMRLTEEDRGRLTALASEAEEPAAVVVRKLIRAAHAKLEASRKR